jgi:hypothetical protein
MSGAAIAPPIAAPAASPALAAALRAARPELNARFGHARRRMPGLEGDAFGAFVVGAIGPIVDAAAEVARDRAGEVAYAAYDVALELVGQRLAGAGARDPRVGAVWSRLLAGAPRQVLVDPPRVALAAANALVQLAGTPGARPEAWGDEMIRLASSAPALGAWLAAGQVLAWRAGLAHYRASALALLARLPVPLASALLGLPPAADPAAVLARLVADPWFDPARPALAAGGVRVAARVGGFRGLGGLFVAPPRVCGGPQLVVTSGDEGWVLCADACGASFHRASDGELAAAHAADGGVALPAGVALVGNTIEHPGGRIALPVRGAITSVARVGSTLAITGADTHAVVLLALPASP